jgi:hypothetical protein
MGSHRADTSATYGSATELSAKVNYTASSSKFAAFKSTEELTKLLFDVLLGGKNVIRCGETNLPEPTGSSKMLRVKKLYRYCSHDLALLELGRNLTCQNGLNEGLNHVWIPGLAGIFHKLGLHR